MTTVAPAAASMPVGSCACMNAAMAPTAAAAATADAAATPGGGSTSAPATDIATAIQQLQLAVEQLTAAISAYTGVTGGGSSVAQATSGAENLGVVQQSPPTKSTDTTTDSSSSDAEQTDPNPPEPPQTEPTQTEPTQTKPTQTKPTQTEPTQTEPTQPSSPSSFDHAKLTVKGRSVDAKQRENIRLVLEKGHELGASDKVMTAAIETIIVESTARNLKGGDLDSVGLFQQRGGWGSFDERHDPKTAAGKFYKRAIKYADSHPNVSSGTLSQKVQISAYPDRYAKYKDEASTAVAAYKASFGA